MDFTVYSGQFFHLTGKEMTKVNIKKMRHRDGRKSGIISSRRSKEGAERKSKTCKTSVRTLSKSMLYLHIAMNSCKRVTSLGVHSLCNNCNQASTVIAPDTHNY